MRKLEKSSGRKWKHGGSHLMDNFNVETTQSILSAINYPKHIPLSISSASLVKFPKIPPVPIHHSEEQRSWELQLAPVAESLHYIKTKDSSESDSPSPFETLDSIQIIQMQKMTKMINDTLTPADLNDIVNIRVPVQTENTSSFQSFVLPKKLACQSKTISHICSCSRNFMESGGRWITLSNATPEVMTCIQDFLQRQYLKVRAVEIHMFQPYDVPLVYAMQILYLAHYLRLDELVEIAASKLAKNFHLLDSFEGLSEALVIKILLKLSIGEFGLAMHTLIDKNIHQIDPGPIWLANFYKLIKASKNAPTLGASGMNQSQVFQHSKRECLEFFFNEHCFRYFNSSSFIIQLARYEGASVNSLSIHLEENTTDLVSWNLLFSLLTGLNHITIEFVITSKPYNLSEFLLSIASNYSDKINLKLVIVKKTSQSESERSNSPLLELRKYLLVPRFPVQPVSEIHIADKAQLFIKTESSLMLTQSKHSKAAPKPTYHKLPISLKLTQLIGSLDNYMAHTYCAPYLVCLDLSNSDLGFKDAVHLSKQFSQSKTLLELNLSNTKITAHGLIYAISNLAQLQKLSVSNVIEKESQYELECWKRLAMIKSAKAFFDCISNDLSELNVSGITQAALFLNRIAHMKYIGLRKCGLLPRHFELLFNCSETNLVKIDISESSFDPTSANLMMVWLSRSPCREISLSKMNGSITQWLPVILKNIKSTKLEHIDLSFNALSDDFCGLLYEYSNLCKQILSWNLEGNLISNKGLDILRKIRRNKCQEFNLLQNACDFIQHDYRGCVFHY